MGKRLNLVVAVLIYELLLNLVCRRIILVLILAKGESTLPNCRVLQLRLGGHESNRSLLLRHIARGHELLRIDHGKKTVQCFDFIDFLWISNVVLILQVLLRAQLCRHVGRRLPIDIALLERVEHFLLGMIERVGRSILLLIVGRDAIHQGFEREPIFPLQLKLTFPLKFFAGLMALPLFLRKALRLKLHETMYRLVVASWRLPLRKLVLCNCTRCRGIRQDNVLILHLAK